MEWTWSQNISMGGIEQYFQKTKSSKHSTYSSYIEINDCVAIVNKIWMYVNSDSTWKAQNYIQNVASEKFRKQFYFLTCILPDYVPQESLKEFWKNSHFENMLAGFPKGVKIHFGKVAKKWCIFRHEKNMF